MLPNGQHNFWGLVKWSIFLMQSIYFLCCNIPSYEMLVSTCEGSPEILGQACTSVPNAVIGRWDGGSRWVMAPPCRPTCLGQFLPGGPCHQLSESSVLLPACQLALKKGEGLLWRRGSWVSRTARCEAGPMPAWFPAWLQLSNSSNSWQDGVRTVT